MGGAPATDRCQTNYAGGEDRAASLHPLALRLREDAAVSVNRLRAGAEVWKICALLHTGIDRLVSGQNQLLNSLPSTAPERSDSCIFV